jgi:hypothetical protein
MPGQPISTDAAPAPHAEWMQAMMLHLWFGDHPALKRPEALQTLSAVLGGGSMGPGAGWFHPSQSRYDWSWLAAHSKVGVKAGIRRADWRGPSNLFDRLDRDGDGSITAADLDWSPQSPFLREAGKAQQWFGRMDGDSNGRVSREEWSAFFDKVAGDKGFLTPEDLRRLTSPPQTTAKSGGMPKSKEFSAMLLKALLNNELGSPYEGPKLGEEAPDFVLPTADGKHQLSLAEFRGKKPVVLIFGSFT